jgi:VanZ family protein
MQQHSKWKNRGPWRFGHDGENPAVTASNSPHVASQAAPSQRHYVWITLGFLAFVLYGSFVPFDFRGLALEEAISRFRVVCSESIKIESRSDWAANFALFVPLGFLLMASFCVDRRRYLAPIVALFVEVFCCALTTLIEFFQLFFPSRVSSIQDIAAESIGGAAGTLVWLLAGQRSTRWARGVWSSVEGQGLAGRLLPGYLVFLMLLSLLPLNLTLSPVEMFHKYKDGWIRIVPFAPHHENLSNVVLKHIWTFIYFFPMGVLLAQLGGKTWRSGRVWLRVFLFGFAAAGFMEFLKLFVIGRYSDTANVILGAAAVMTGWFLVHSHDAHFKSPPSARNNGRTLAPGLGLAVFRWLLLLMWAAVVVFVNWHPFDFRGGRDFLATRLSQVALIPFADYFMGDYWQALDQFLQKSLLYALLGVLFALTLRQGGQRRAAFGAVGVAALVATAIEVGQLFLPSRYASITDILVESFGAWLGCSATCHARSLLEAGAQLRIRPKTGTGPS